jgi:serine/threonine-protein kinase
VGRYRVLRRLAKGTTSEVLLARQHGPLGFDRLVVVKLLLPELRGNARARDGLLCEAAAYARVSHPAIVRLHDFLSHDRDLAIVLEHVDGLPLHEVRAQLHRRGERLKDAPALYLASRLFAALSAAHAARNPATGEFTPVVHADVNPSNVLLPWDGYVKLTDFGSARVTGMTDRAADPAVHPYLAPEQARRAEVSTRTDVYSGCLLLWELLTNRRGVAPDRRSTREMLRDIGRPALPSLGSLRPDLPASLVSVVERGLEPIAEQRRVAVADVLAALRDSTDLGAARIELAEVMGTLRRPAAEAERFDTTPELPDVSGPTAIPPGRDKAISASFWLVDDAESPPPAGGVAAAPWAGTPALADLAASPIGDPSRRTDRPVMLPENPEPPTTGTWHRARVATAIAAAALALIIGATALRSARRPPVRAALAVATPGPRASAEPVAPRSSATEPSRMQTAPQAPSAPPASSTAEAPCSSPGWVIVPSSRAGHRVWIDGRLVGGSPGRFQVSVGRHAVRVGSHGALRSLVVGCAEERLAP